MSAPTGKRDRRREAAARQALADNLCFGKKDCVLLWDSAWPMADPPGNPEATPECDAIHDCDWIVYRCNYPADFDGGVAL